MQEFFRRFGMPNGPQGRGFENQPRQGEGSGFIVSADGYILTNAHVVADADEVTVRTTDRREYTAKVVGLDKRTDVAVLKIEGKDLPVVRLGDPVEAAPGRMGAGHRFAVHVREQRHRGHRQRHGPFHAG